MATSPAPSPAPAATCIPYDKATPAQLALALAYLMQELADHFPTLDFATWGNTMLAYKPDLWVAGEQVYLDYADVTLLTQRLATSPSLPELDPPIYPDRACYLAKRMVNYQDEALEALDEMAENPLAYGPRVFAVVTSLALGNSVADNVFAATHRGPQGRPGSADPALARAAAPERIRALRAARGALGHLPLPSPPAAPAPGATPGQ
jgi:hypothetical protein